MKWVSKINRECANGGLLSGGSRDDISNIIFSYNLYSSVVLFSNFFVLLIIFLDFYIYFQTSVYANFIYEFLRMRMSGLMRMLLGCNYSMHYYLQIGA